MDVLVHLVVPWFPVLDDDRHARRRKRRNSLGLPDLNENFSLVTQPSPERVLQQDTGHRIDHRQGWCRGNGSD